MNIVPVVSKNQNTLMPTSPAKARKLIRDKKATPFYKLGIFCIRLNFDTQDNLQPICIAIDSGSKREAYTIRSKSKTYLNIQCNAIDWVKDNMQARSEMRRARRFRNTPCRPPRFLNRGSSKHSRLPPSTKARWQLKINVVKKLLKVFPIKVLRIEDISSMTFKGIDRRNKSFGPLQNGKRWFKKEIKHLGLSFVTNSGFQTSLIRKKYKLDYGMINGKIRNKLSDDFRAHCIDSWTLATNSVRGNYVIDNKDIIYLAPSIFSRRQLHKRQHQSGGNRPREGGTRLPCGLTKGSIVKHIKPTNTLLKFNKRAIFLVGGYDFDKNGKIKITLCALDNQSARISRTINPQDVRMLAYNRYTYRYSMVKSKNR